MLPLKLSITGLYSYQKKQTIDFEELTNAGLFGIFGAVGSGKSSVLEAIGFVLYGETDRLNKTDKRAYNMLNLKSDRANIEFEFLNFEERKFKFVADWKRKKRFEETTTIERLAYEWKEEQWIPMTSADATEIIGLTYENFRRTIIIPQGKFNEFLGLKGKERSDMMKEIFHLERFDLSYKVSALQRDTTSKLDFLKGELSGFEAISAEAIALLENEVVTAAAELQMDKIELSLAEIELNKLTVLKANFEALEKKKSQLLTLFEQKPKMDALEAEIVAFEITEKAFKAILNEQKVAIVAFEKTKEQYLFLENKKKEVEIDKASNQGRINALQPQFDQLESSKNKVSDLESIEKILVLEQEVALIVKKDKDAELLFLETEKKENELKNELKNFYVELTDLKSKKVDGTKLLDVGNWYAKEELFQVQLTEKKTRIKTIQDYLVKQKTLFSELELPFDSWKAAVEAKREVLLVDNKATLEVKTKLLVSKELAHYADNLHDGADCPLCGSPEHPKVMQAEDVSDQLRVIEARISQLENQAKEIDEIQTKASKIEHLIGHAVEQLQLTLSEKATLEAEVKIHLSKFVWTDFVASDNSAFLAKRNEQEIIEKTIAATELKEKEIRVREQQLADELKQQMANKAIIASDKAAKDATIINELSQLKALAFADYAETKIDLIREEKTKLHQENNRVASEYKLNTEAIQLQNNELSGLKANLKLLNEQAVSSEQLLQEIQKNIAELLKIHHFDSLESVQIILSKTLDISFEKNKTKQFAVDLKVLEKAVAESEILVMNQTFDAKIFEEKGNLVSSHKLKYENQLGKVSTLQDNIERVKMEFIKKADLLSQFDVLKTRSINLATLANMFNASGFVNYVSSIYLQNLADVANVRFHRMTKNQLSLTINSSNEFEVIDYLNNGFSRSVKTLSGGQGFQASLCLALALAESVQSLNKNYKNFFFIDEGFGTQDPESISVVFETLQSLYKENRIVGIISHVGELQERIPRSVNVFKDEENGSVVSESWN